MVSYGGNNVTTPASGGWQLIYTDNPRIRMESVFKKGATSTPFALLTEMYLGNSLNGLSYEIRTLSNVPMSGSGDQRILSYDGQAILSEFGNGRAKAVPRPSTSTFRCRCSAGSRRDVDVLA